MVNIETFEETRTRYIQVFLALVAFFLFYYLNTLTANALHKSVLLTVLHKSHGIDSFFRIPVYFYGFIQRLGIPLDVFGLISGAVLTAFFFQTRTSYWVFGVKVFLLIPAFMLYLGTPSKEFFLLIFLIGSVGLWARGWFFASSIVEMVYAGLFRAYFAPFALVKFLGRYIPRPFLYLGVALLPIVMCFTPGISDGIASLIDRRGIALLENRGIIRSSFENPLIMTGSESIFFNYVYALARLNLPIFFYVGPRELFLQVYIIVFLSAVLVSKRCGPEVKTGLLVHMLVLGTFEPDLGSYIRHLSSLFPWVFAILEGRFAHQQQARA